jgi:eukaryotic-like serine/threonine-protein kinase
VAIAYRHVREDPTPPRMLNPDVPAPLEAICLKAMAKLPDNRYQTAAEMHDDLQRFRNGQPVLATPLLDAAATTQAIPRDGGADPTAMLGEPVADRATRYAEPEEEERRTSVGWIVVSLLALVAVGLAAFFITQALTDTDTPTVTTVTVPTTAAPTTAAPTTAPPTTAPPTTAPPTTAPTTQPPTTQPPTTEPPTSEPATSEPSTTGG